MKWESIVLVKMKWKNAIFAKSTSQIDDELEENSLKSEFENRRVKFFRKGFINGPSHSGKTSLAFQIAYEEASYGGIPLFICQKSKFQRQFPKQCQELHEDSSDYMETGSFNPTVLSRIYMKYTETSQDLLNLLAGLQKFQPKPTVIIIDDLSSFLPSFTSSDSNLNRFAYQSNYSSHDQKIDFYLLLLAMIDDTAYYLTEDTVFLVVDTVEDKNMIHLVKRYMDVIISMMKKDHQVEIKKIVRNQGEIEGEYALDREQSLGRSILHNNTVICFEKEEGRH